MLLHSREAGGGDLGSIGSGFPKDYPAEDPDRGPLFIARVSRHAVPKTPGYLRSALYICDPARVSLPLTITITSDALAGSRRKRGL